ncbi:hypothetical protein [Aphanothece sacrum]|uniref:Uncharacterized protein n=1 Tax=Aphanothece sacrum FPU1 TaxID=1920663 RepID=A0A401IM79_APHSA|nr:hypothetical protein [Aphanothece sacrum]GBF82364.1 hypothetical protein AsFPU1_3792 [Aphanothece sacrum FPU1]GBF84264.1 hypothetical protein AsFPU3_1311 [Aphanothece sacrum FPU3]
MRAYLKDEILVIDKEDLPPYKKGGSIVRNGYFWALKSIACYTRKECNWEFDQPVWVALSRMLLSFSESGYLGYSETILEFPLDTPIPDTLRSVSTWL